jgi:hypothetical protein
MMMLRNLSHHPLRAVFTTLGMALATALIIVRTRDEVTTGERGQAPHFDRLLVLT